MSNVFNMYSDIENMIADIVTWYENIMNISHIIYISNLYHKYTSINAIYICINIINIMLIHRRNNFILKFN